MTRYLLKQLAGMVAVLLAASFVIYLTVYLTPGSPEAFLFRGRTADPEALAAVRAQYRLDDPFLVRYLAWLGDALRGDLGQSIAFQEPVTRRIGQALPTTGLLVLMGGLLTAVVGVGLGALGAVRGRVVNSVVTLFTSVGVATPSFVAAIVLIAVFSMGLGWFPVFGDGQGLVDRIYHLVLPAISLALLSAAFMARISRLAMVGELRREHVQTARSRGLPAGHIFRRHVLRNSLVPILTVAAIQTVALLSGTVIVESAFGLNGLGSLLLQSVQQKDFAMVQAICLIYVSTFIVVNVAVDVLYGFVNPQLRVGKAGA